MVLAINYLYLFISRLSFVLLFFAEKEVTFSTRFPAYNFLFGGSTYLELRPTLVLPLPYLALPDQSSSRLPVCVETRG